MKRSFCCRCNDYHNYYQPVPSCRLIRSTGRLFPQPCQRGFSVQRSLLHVCFPLFVDQCVDLHPANEYRNSSETIHSETQNRLPVVSTSDVGCGNVKVHQLYLMPNRGLMSLVVRRKEPPLPRVALAKRPGCHQLLPSFS